MTIDLQRRIEEPRAPNGRGCPNGLRRDDDIVALLDELVRAMAEWDALSYPVRVEEEREKLRQECHADLDALRTDSEMPERAFRLLEKLVARLDRIETGSFHETESPTKPERRHSATWSNEGVMKALEKGRKKDDE